MARDEDLGSLSTWFDETSAEGRAADALAQERRAAQAEAEEDFARGLRERVDLVAPPVPVRLDRVVPRARRRRALVRGVASCAAAAAVLGGVAVVQALPWESTAVAPASQETEDPSQGAATDDVAEEVSTGEEAVSATGGTFWYVLSESRDPGTTDAPEVMESWSSLDQPGLLVWGGDLSTAAGKGPSDVVGRFRIDGEWVDMLREPERLPTDAAGLGEVLRASVEPDRRSGSDDEKVFGMARDLMTAGGLVPDALRRAAWEVATGLPGAQMAPGEDSTGRAGQVVEYTQDGAPVRIVWDEDAALKLEETSDGWTSILLEQRFSTDPLPVEPTLENAGCAQWSTC
ncbi:hypothetical protein [Actinotalea sp. K2]|uniref:hypothetical protein n=1 Tax=Actinotalea sp. K2 TaxID=2939438 RepID=UPI0020181973|nr:hypothetical protein [Actinotalea sp. K2]MCL3860898.1 hypothetical protein [Actinotalea sp. K2]